MARKSHYDDKVILITGACGGLGTELVRQLAATRARLILSDVAARAPTRHPRVLAYIPADLRRKDPPRKLVAAALRHSPRIDMLFNNAGVATIGNFVDTPDDRWEALLQINLLAPMRLAKCLLPHMIENGSGHIVNISSIGAHVALPKTAPYAASKWGLRGFGAAIHAELAEYGVEVTNVYPSFTRTPILQSQRFGPSPARDDLPRFLVDEPAEVVSALLEGVARGELHVFPSRRSQALGQLSRIAPGAASLLTRNFWELIG